MDAWTVWPYTTNGGYSTFSTISFDPVTRIFRYDIRMPSAEGWVTDFLEGDFTGLAVPWENGAIVNDALFVGGNGEDIERYDEYIIMDTYLDASQRQQLFDAWSDPDASTEAIERGFTTITGTIVEETVTPAGGITETTITPVGGITPV